MRRLLAISAAFIVSALASGAVAEPISNDWTVTLGVEGRVLPKYEGSSDSVLLPFPLFNIRRAGTPAKFRAPRDGASFDLLDYGRFRAGPTAKIRMGRDQSDNIRLRGLGDVDWAFEAGAFAEYWATDWLRGRVELRQGFGGHHGLISDVTADVVVPATSQLTLSGGPRLTLATAAAMDPYFSVTPVQAIASGLPVYDAGSGVRSYGAGAQARYVWSPQWATHVFVEYERLASDAANSPIVTGFGKRDEIQVGFGATYSFDMKSLW